MDENGGTNNDAGNVDNNDRGLGCCDDEGDVGSDDESYDHSKDQR